VNVTGLSGPSNSLTLMAVYGPSSQGLPSDAQEWIHFAYGTLTVTYTPLGGTPTVDPVTATSLGGGDWEVELTLADAVVNGGTLQVVAPGSNPSPAEAGEFPGPVSNEVIVSPGSTGSASAQTTNAVTFSAPGTTPNESSNWSGYGVTSGPFASVTGTFTVPYLTTDAACDEETSEWVGIDGLHNSQLVQAGVSESMTNPFTGACTPGLFYSWAWWEVLPSYLTPIASWEDGGPAVVTAGDQVTVTITASGSISLVDNNDLDGAGAGVFTTGTAYNGPATSAEWVVEAPDDDGACGGSCTLAPYSGPSGNQPGVTFSALGVAGYLSAVDEIFMVQGGDEVSAPTPMGPTGFGSSYVGSFESPMATAGQAMHGSGAVGHKLLHPAVG
jgi:hypothetical protein